MAEKGIYSPFIRKIITIALFAGIIGSFISMYYLVYLPQERSSYNLRVFRILHEIANNFSEAVEKIGASYFYSLEYRSEKSEQELHKDDFTSDSATVFSENFKKSLLGDPTKIDSFISMPSLEQDSINYKIKLKQKNHITDSLKKSIKDILGPLISIHPNTFEEVLLIRPNNDTFKKGMKNSGALNDAILYKSEHNSISNIKTDSLLHNSNVETPGISDINIEGVKYKMFLMPFQINVISNETFVLIGTISEESYREQTQNIPIQFFLTLGLILVFLLLVLPFIKIFILSIYENITIADVRAIIAVIFIIPFVITLLCSAIWIHIYAKRYSNDVLSSLQKNITANFYKETSELIQQAKDYDSLIQNPRKDGLPADIEKRRPEIDTRHIRDYIFYPRYYRNIENVHWLNGDGNDIAAWTFTTRPPRYFKLADREYFTDIRDHKGYVLPHPYYNAVKDTFSIQATLSRFTGEYTINVATKSDVEIWPQKKAIAVAVSAKMYSVYNTVTPPGFSYCLINDSGNMIFHSDTVRSLRENLIEESDNNQQLLTAIKHKDTAMIEDIDLYDKPVKMLIKPLPTLPFYLVTYYNKRAQYLFTFHVAAFVFVCESILLLFVSIFSYCIMISDKQISKLFFIPGLFTWLKPSPQRVNYYSKNNLQLIICLLFLSLFYIFVSRENAYIYFLNCALLLPLFAVTGYYIIKREPTFIYLLRDSNQHIRLIFKKKLFRCFLFSIKNIVLLYIISILFFAIFQYVLFYDELGTGYKGVVISIGVLIVLLPLIFIIIAGINFESISSTRKRNAESLNELKEGKKHNKDGYLNYFIISLLLSVMVLSVIPTITLTSYAFHEEKKLSLQSLQLELAKRIQQRRTDINTKINQTKLSLQPGTAPCFRDSLKFCTDKGLYIYNNSIDSLPDYSLSGTSAIDSLHSPFYKTVTKILFLPPDHDEFFDNTSHNAFYHWEKAGGKKPADSLQLFYKNFTDHVNSSSFSLKGSFFNFTLANFLFHNSLGFFILFAILLFIFLFYRILCSVSRRIFLIGYFKNKEIKDENLKEQQDPDWLKQKYKIVDLTGFCESFSLNADKVSFAEIRKKEKRLLKENDGGEGILKMHLALLPVYDNIWKDCNNEEKYTLYDFALDGFTNYKKILILYQLYKKGLLVRDEDQNLRLMSHSFRNFLITKETTEEIKTLTHIAALFADFVKKGSFTVKYSSYYYFLVSQDAKNQQLFF